MKYLVFCLTLVFSTHLAEAQTPTTEIVNIGNIKLIEYNVFILKPNTRLTILNAANNVKAGVVVVVCNLSNDEDDVFLTDIDGKGTPTNVQPNQCRLARRNGTGTLAARIRINAKDTKIAVTIIGQRAE